MDLFLLSEIGLGLNVLIVKLLSGNELSEDYTHPNIQIYAIYSLFSMKTTFFFRDNAMFSIF